MMKINPFLTLCALLIGGLIFYGFHAAENSLLYAVTTAAVSSIALVGLLGLRYEDDARHSMLLKVVSLLLLFISLSFNFVFAWLGVFDAVVIITNGLLLIIWAIVVYLLTKLSRVS